MPPPSHELAATVQQPCGIGRFPWGLNLLLLRRQTKGERSGMPLLESFTGLPFGV